MDPKKNLLVHDIEVLYFQFLTRMIRVLYVVNNKE
jgi:hypothetical protein